MSSRALVLGFAAALMASSAASAQAVSSVARSATVESAPKDAKMGDPNRTVCKSLTATGSRLAKAKVCKTARQWAEQEYEHRKELERLQVPRTPDAG